MDVAAAGSIRFRDFPWMPAKAEGGSMSQPSLIWTQRSNHELARMCAQFSPRGRHDPAYLKDLLCLLGLHRWSQLDVDHLLPRKDVRFCRWCESVKVDGSMYRAR
jgi:hypothetical protein